TYIFFFPALLLWLGANFCNLRSTIAQSPQGGRLLMFLFVTGITSVFGINPERSLLKLPMAMVYALGIFMFRDLVGKVGSTRLITALIAGQTISSFYSLIESSCLGQAPQLFVGTVSESGQLALTFIVALGLAIYKPDSAAPSSDLQGLLFPRLNTWTAKPVAVLSFITFGAIAFSYYFNFNQAIRVIVIACGGILALFCWLILFDSLKSRNQDLKRTQWALISCLLPLMFVALLANLKRGPWLGVFTAAFLLMFVCRKKYIFLLLIGALATLVALPPARARLAHSYNDFMIAGGRSVIWKVGSELLTTYPLGIGYKNSAFLREFAPEVPPELRHFHNTALNVLIETGWVVLLAFCWWIWAVLRSAFRSFWTPPLKILPLSIGCAVISWLMAGLVEYNFGDSEVKLILFLLLGILAWQDKVETPNPDTP
ncbi:MAG: O-antigen ligase family protein, partial [Deltaproteobacteria bacterium]|nr:O-antigen ligase family protein [Deltaproteobacteria bacterium]